VSVSRLNKEQRLFYANGLRDLSHIAAGALVFGQAFAGRFNSWLFAIGFAFVVVAYMVGNYLLKLSSVIINAYELFTPVPFLRRADCFCPDFDAPDHHERAPTGTQAQITHTSKQCPAVVNPNTLQRRGWSSVRLPQASASASVWIKRWSISLAKNSSTS
jgi:hypothetical protein